MKEDKKILIFSTAYYPFVGGAEVAVKEITDRIPDVNFDLITARFKRSLPKFEKVGNVNVYRIGVGIGILDKLFLPFYGASKAAQLNRKKHYDAFWGIMASFGSGAAYVANFFIKEKVPIVLTLQEGDSEEHFGKRWFGLINISWGLALRKTQVVTAISSFLANRAREFGYRGEVKIIPNGVDIGKFDLDMPDTERSRLRKELGLGDGDIALVTASRLVVKNGIGDVVEALSGLDDNVKFVILGAGELEGKLKKLAQNLEVSERVIWRGYVSHEELPKILKSCDIFIRPSLSEGMGNSFLEAMVARLPVIATPVGGIVDFLQDGETGYFCKPENPESIAETVKRTVSDPDKGLILEKAYKIAEEKYSWPKIASQMKDVFDSISR